MGFCNVCKQLLEDCACTETQKEGKGLRKLLMAAMVGVLFTGCGALHNRYEKEYKIGHVYHLKNGRGYFACPTYMGISLSEREIRRCTRKEYTKKKYHFNGE